MDRVHEVVHGPGPQAHRVVHGPGPRGWSMDLGPCFVYVLADLCLLQFLGTFATSRSSKKIIAYLLKNKSICCCVPELDSCREFTLLDIFAELKSRALTLQNNRYRRFTKIDAF